VLFAAAAINRPLRISDDAPDRITEPRSIVQLATAVGVGAH
jgi:hypothetical protein